MSGGSYIGGSTVIRVFYRPSKVKNDELILAKIGILNTRFCLGFSIEIGIQVALQPNTPELANWDKNKIFKRYDIPAIGKRRTAILTKSANEKNEGCALTKNTNVTSPLKISSNNLGLVLPRFHGYSV